MMGLEVVQIEKLEFIFTFAEIRYYKRNTIVFIKDTSKCFSFLMRTPSYQRIKIIVDRRNDLSMDEK